MFYRKEFVIIHCSRPCVGDTPTLLRTLSVCLVQEWHLRAREGHQYMLNLHLLRNHSKPKVNYTPAEVTRYEL